MDSKAQRIRQARQHKLNYGHPDTDAEKAIKVEERIEFNLWWLGHESTRQFLEAQTRAQHESVSQDEVKLYGLCAALVCGHPTHNIHCDLCHPNVARHPFLAYPGQWHNMAERPAIYHYWPLGPKYKNGVIGKCRIAQTHFVTGDALGVTCGKCIRAMIKELEGKLK